MKIAAYFPVVLALVLTTGCETNAPTAEAAQVAAPVIRTAPITATTWTPHTEMTGSLEPIAAVQLGFDVPGRIEKLYVKRGDIVKAGQAVAKLDDSLAVAQAAQAKAGVDAARSQAEAADSSWGRIEKMGDGVSGQTRSEADAGVKGAKAMLLQSEAAEKLARTQLNWHTLRSPIDGIVTTAPDNPGSLVGAGTPTFTIEDLSSFRLKGSVPEADNWVAAGQTAVVHAGGPGVSSDVPGVVERVIPSLDAQTRRIPVEVRVDTPPAGLLAHSFVRADLAASEGIPALSIPRGALIARPEFGVIVQGAGVEPKFIPVTVLEEREEFIIVRGDIAEGQLVVVNPPHGYGE